MLRVTGNQIIDKSGQKIRLQGTCLGGWMNMEGFITGYPGTEEHMRESLKAELGQEKVEHYFQRFLESFFTDADAKYLKSLGFNVLRIPINYRHFEDDMAPFELQESGFDNLHRVIEICAANEIYTIIDLHALPGYQNQHWHSDNPTHVAFLWKHKHFQDRTVYLWEELARCYKDNEWVAGYNLINEPADPTTVALIGLYDRLIDAIREIDPDHIIFLDGNRFSRDWRGFPAPWDNTVYAFHYYPPPGQLAGGIYPGEMEGQFFNKETIRKEMFCRASYMLEHDVPIWIGEFSPVYPTLDTPVDSPRYQVLRDQLDIVNELNAHWTTWTYKDVGLQGIVYTSPDSAYVQQVKPALDKIQYLGADVWSGTEANIDHIIDPLNQLLSEVTPDYDPYPFGAGTRIRRLLRGMLFPDAITPSYAKLFKALDKEQLIALADSFLFENCHPHENLARILKLFASSEL